MADTAKQQQEKEARAWAEEYCASIGIPYQERGYGWYVDLLSALYLGLLEKHADVLQDCESKEQLEEHKNDLQEIAKSIAPYAKNDMETINIERAAEGKNPEKHYSRLATQAAARCLDAIGILPQLIINSDRDFFKSGVFRTRGDYFCELFRRDFTRGKDGQDATAWAGLGKTRSYGILKSKAGTAESRAEKAMHNRATMQENALDALRRYNRKVRKINTEGGDSYTLREISECFCRYWMGADRARY